MSFISTITNLGNTAKELGVSSDPSVSAFISKLDKGIARPSRFRCSFNLPSGIEDASMNIDAFNIYSRAGSTIAVNLAMNMDGKINMFCHTVTLPLRAMTVFSHRTHTGPGYSAPYAATYEPVTLSFYTDNTFNTRNYFDVWQQVVTNISSDTNNYWDEFVSDVNFYVMDAEGNDIYNVTLVEAWPSSISSVDLAYSNTNALLNVSVTFQYKFWRGDANSIALLNNLK